MLYGAGRVNPQLLLVARLRYAITMICALSLLSRVPQKACGAPVRQRVLGLLVSYYASSALLARLLQPAYAHHRAGGALLETCFEPSAA